MFGIDLSEYSKTLVSESYNVSLDDYIIDLAWAPDGSQLAAVTVEGAVALIDNSGKVKPVGQHGGGGNSVSWRQDGVEFATAGHDGLARIWQADSGQELGTLEAGDSWVGKVLYHGQNMATAAGRHIKIFDQKRNLLYESAEHESTIADLGWHPDGSSIAAAAYRGITIHTIGHDIEPQKYKWKGSSLVLAFSPNAKYIATGEQDSTVHFCYLETGEDAQMKGFPSKVLEMSWCHNSEWLATSGGSSICLWKCSGEGPAGRKPNLYEGHTSKLTQLAFQPGGEWLASADADSFLAIWAPFKHEKIIGGVVLSAPATSLRWYGRDKIAAGQENGKIVVFDLKS